MNLDLEDCTFSGPAFPAPFVRFGLTAQLAKLRLLSTHDAALEKDWRLLRREFRSTGGAQSICNHIVIPLARRLGFDPPVRQADVATREGSEDGGWLMQSACGARLRAWCFASGTDLDAPHRSGRAYRFSPMRCAQRVLMARGESLGLMTDGEELRLLICDPVRSDSHIAIPINGTRGWRAQDVVPDSARLLLALASPHGIAALPQVLDAARLSQTRVTKDLRFQARRAIEGFLQALIDHPSNAFEHGLDLLADRLWEEGLILVYRLLFILKLESVSDPARAFSFASTELWRGTLSPNRALGPLVRRALDLGHDTGQMLEGGLRALFSIFCDGLSCSELSVPPLSGALFGTQATPLLDRLVWGERAVAVLLDRLLWTAPAGRPRERVHYGSLDVEDLGRIYEALLELEPGITTAPMSRLRRAKLEMVLPADLGVRYRTSNAGRTRTQVTWVEDIPVRRFFLRTGIGRKATGSYYTPHEFVRYLVRETLAPEVARRSTAADPDPAAILAIKVVDPATGSGHFLVEACRYLADALYAACRACDEGAVAAEEAAERALPADRIHLLERAALLRQRVGELPDPNGLLSAYLPSRATDGGATGVSQARALAICRRLVAVHCLYGVDNNRLAVELAKLSLWLESYAEGLPLTFLDHRVIHGDSIGGPSLVMIKTLPVSGQPIDPLVAREMNRLLADTRRSAVHEIDKLRATIGIDSADLALKEAARRQLDKVLYPLRSLVQAWVGAVMSGEQRADDEWLDLARTVAMSGTWPALTGRQAAMQTAGQQALSWDLTFPEVFGDSDEGGFTAVLSNPPWDIMQPNTAEFLAGYDLSILDTEGRREAHAIRDRLLAEPRVAAAWDRYQTTHRCQQRLVARLYHHQRYGNNGAIMGGKLDLYRVFAERMVQLLNGRGAIGMVVPSAFHANEGATGLRRFYLRETRIEQCLSFENRQALFDIHVRYKFALVVARKPGPTTSMRCGFYLTDFHDLENRERHLEYSADFLAASGGAHSTLLELRSPADLAMAARLFRHKSWADWTHEQCIALSREIHMSDDAGSFTRITALCDPGATAMPALLSRLGEREHLLLHEGKTIHQFSDMWDSPPRYAIALQALAGKPHSIESARYFRAACREIARSTDERTAIAAILPPGVLCGHTISVERRPGNRASAAALLTVAVMNSFPFDWLLRQKATIHVSLYILADLAVPDLGPDARRFLAHASLRLCCNHAGFAPLWHEQLGDLWRESTDGWPVLPIEAKRWRLRAAMDAVIAHGFGLSRPEYARLLAGFSHRSFPEAPSLCLSAFDELADIGTAAFCRVHDPYSDVALVMAAPRPSMH